MNAALPHITVCICTYQRPQMLRRLLEALARQQTGEQFAMSAVVADNDPRESARQVVSEFAARAQIPVIYTTEPRKNIALARNAALRQARGTHVAFIDDDEFPAEDWLAHMLSACRMLNATGI